jgi:prepilin-type processing-associated H-X9-DG protein
VKRSEVACVCLLLLILAAFLDVPVGFLVEFVFYLLVGWFLFLKETIPRMTIEPAAVVVAGVALVALTIVAHRIARWLFGSFRAGETAITKAPRWRFRWTTVSVLLVVFTFAAGIAMVATFHQLWWLVSSKEPLLTFGAWGAARRSQSQSNLATIGRALHDYEVGKKTLPPGGTFNQYGEAQHSWETMLLPYIDCAQYEPPRKDLPWNHPKNAASFKTSLPLFLNPGVNDRDYSPEGYALSDYSVNSRVMHGNSSLRAEDVKDGLANTIMGGEVNANFKPWGDPVNWRDPADGLGKSPEGFGGPWKSGVTNMLFMDGSVRTMSNDVDPQVLKALSTPAGGEDVREFMEKN